MRATSRERLGESVLHRPGYGSPNTWTIYIYGVTIASVGMASSFFTWSIYQILWILINGFNPMMECFRAYPVLCWVANKAAIVATTVTVTMG